jgi:hypothetical protein
VARSRKEWAKVRAAYIAGEGSYAEIGKRFGIPGKTVRTRAAKEKWTAARDRTAALAGQKAEEKAAESLSDVKALRLKLGAAMLRKAEKTLDEVDLFDPEGLAHLARAVNGAIPADFISDLDGDGSPVAEGVEIVIRRRRGGGGENGPG